jgi:ring-1,2-phenylacetyl-CoA epoxidase subunit PaaB
MTDTQWPRFEVFIQADEGKPLQHAGSVHAPDSEMAVLNARDVFVRRPKCLNLWVVPADRMIHRTSEELSRAWPESAQSRENAKTLYHVFRKESHRGTLVHTASVEERSPWEALRVAMAGRKGLAWAIFPREAVTGNDPEDRSSFFDPALGKEYRLHAQYRVYELLRKARAGKELPRAGTGPRKGPSE